MAGPKQSSSLPSKKPKAKAAKPATVPKPALSSEFVVDSDDSGDAETAARKGPISETASFRSNTVQQAASKSSASQGKPSKKRKLPSSSPAENDSSGSDSGKHRNNQDVKRPTKKTILADHNERPTVKSKPATAPPVLAKPSMKPSTNIKPLNKNKQRGPGGSSRESDSEAEEGSYDSSSTESESDSGKESTSMSSDKTSLHSPEKENPVQNGVSQQPTLSYEPPDGFEPTSISIHPASKLSEVLAPSNLQGKQIWHITVPELVSISSIKEVPSESIGSGASILEHHGAKYGLVPESDIEQRSDRALLLPSTQTNKYQPSKTNIIRTLHLQQIVSLPRPVPGPANQPNRLTSPSDSYRKTPRQQPEGLRMRYRPFGASDDSDVESTPEPMSKAPEFRVPNPVKESSPGKKRKRHESIDSSSKAASPAKSKKRKQSPQATAGAIDDPIDIDAISAMKSNRAQGSNKDSHPELNGVQSKGNLPNGTERKKEGKKRASRDSSGMPSITSINKREKEKKKPEKREPPSKPATALLPLDVKKDAETIQPGEVVVGIPATANAVEGTKSINAVPSTTTRKDEKAKRKEEKRRRKEREREQKGASSSVPLSNGAEASRRDDDADPDPDPDQMMTEIENAQREAEIPVDVPVQGPGGRDSSNWVGGEEGKKEKRKEKREKKKEKRKMKAGGK